LIQFGFNRTAICRLHEKTGHLLPPHSDVSAQSVQFEREEGYTQHFYSAGHKLTGCSSKQTSRGKMEETEEEKAKERQ
jgi:hypothetical protein